jgi:hypothetical protein
MEDSEINDVRLQKEFKGASFSKFQKQKVKLQLIANIYNCKIEGACYWSAELICAGYFIDLWEIIINYVGKYIHVGNPKLPIYIQLRFNTFKDILNNGYVNNELKMRNNEKIRKLFAELICILCYSPKKHSFESIKIKNDEFDITQLTNRLKAINITHSRDFFLPEDPKELFIPINEFAYHISKESSNNVCACYWLEWIIQFEIICKNKRQKSVCERRAFIPVTSCSQKDLIWIIWDGILKETASRKNKLLTKIVQCLLDIFCIKYTNSSKTKRKYIIYNAISLLTETINYNIKIINNEDMITSITSKIHLIYKDIKKNEIAPQTDYLFSGLDKKTNLEKTIARIEKMNEINIIPQIDNETDSP